MKDGSRKLCILGPGSWGLTLAWLAARNHGRESDDDKPLSISLWGKDADKINAIRTDRHIRFPHELTLPNDVELTTDLAEAVDGADAILFVVTAKGTRPVAEMLRDTGAPVAPDCILVNASKGIEYPSLKTMTGILSEVFPHHDVAALSGPTLAREVLSGLPTACVVAAREIEVAERLQAMLNCERQFRLYTNTDVLGVEFAGAMKNVLAIASGFMTAQELGDNARAALLTRGLAEMARFCLHMGADESTIYGLAGLGDMLATCHSHLSRNFQVGYRLGKGESLDAILADMRVVAEGVYTARAVYTMAREAGLEAPIVELVVSAVSGAPISQEMMIRSLMNRKLKAEMA